MNKQYSKANKRLKREKHQTVRRLMWQDGFITLFITMFAVSILAGAGISFALVVDYFYRLSLS